MHVNKTKFEKKRFPRVLSHDLYWENKTYKLKRGIIINLFSFEICILNFFSKMRDVFFMIKH